MVGEVEQADSGEQPAATLAEKTLVTRWLKRIELAKKHWDPYVKRMDLCQQIAAHGARSEWLAEESRYVVPLVNRHVNLSVSQLYAKDPQAVATPRKKMRYVVWDGTQEQVQVLQARALLGDTAAESQLMVIQQEILEAQVEDTLARRQAETLTLLYAYQIDNQPFSFKDQVKNLVRRVKVNAIGYAKVLFVREMELRPEVTVAYEDSTAKAIALQRLAAEAQEGDGTEAQVAATQATSVLQDFVQQPDRVVREQIIIDFPRSDKIILDPKTRDAKTLLGTNWLAEEFDLTETEIKDIYGADIREYLSAEQGRQVSPDEDPDERTFRVYAVQDKRLRQRFVLCEGSERFIVPPEEPDVYLERFFDVFPLVFNNIEHHKEALPPSDVWITRHMQFEYNRSREGVREHRIAARPYWLAAKGRLSETDRTALANHAAHAIVEVTPDGSNAPLSSVVEAGPTAPIDPNLYETESIHQDLQRSVGAQEANFGGTSGATATETSVAESSRMSTVSDNVDDLDDFLTAIARAAGQIMFRHMSKEMVQAIVGRGAVWPDAVPTRQQAADEIALTIRAGSTGRPNRAAELANLERAWPALSQLPGVNPEPVAGKYATLLDLDVAEISRAGALSIVAQNAMAPSAPAASSDPRQQGGQGAGNARREAERPPGGQPAYPAAGEMPPGMQ